MVAFFLAGLLVLGGQQRWWLQYLLTGMNTTALYFAATLLTGVTDNAALAYLGSLVEGVSADIANDFNKAIAFCKAPELQKVALLFSMRKHCLRKCQSWPIVRVGESLHPFLAYLRGRVELENLLDGRLNSDLDRAQLWGHC